VHGKYRLSWLLKFIPVTCLSAFTFLRAQTEAQRLLAGGLLLHAFGDLGLELGWAAQNTALPLAVASFGVGHVVYGVVFWKTAHAPLSAQNHVAAAVVLALTSTTTFVFVRAKTDPKRWRMKLFALLYMLALTGMGLLSSLSASRATTVGALLYLLSDCIIFLRESGVNLNWLLVWPVYYLGQLLVTEGVLRTG